MSRTYTIGLKNPIVFFVVDDFMKKKNLYL
jgi:hypothetical protein